MRRRTVLLVLALLLLAVPGCVRQRQTPDDIYNPRRGKESLFLAHSIVGDTAPV